MELNNGYGAEHYVGRELEKLGCTIEHKGSYYDIDCTLPDGRRRKLEVKSCRLLTTSKQFKRIWGRFDFKNQTNLNIIKKKYVWLIFVIYINNEYQVCGVINPRKIPNKRWLTITELQHLKMYSWQGFLRKIDLI